MLCSYAWLPVTAQQPAQHRASQPALWNRL